MNSPPPSYFIASLRQILSEIACEEYLLFPQSESDTGGALSFWANNCGYGDPGENHNIPACGSASFRGFAIAHSPSVQIMGITATASIFINRNLVVNMLYILESLCAVYLNCWVFEFACIVYLNCWVFEFKSVIHLNCAFELLYI